MIHCAILGFQIDRDRDCNASGTHLLCRKCLGWEEEKAATRAEKKPVKKRCPCGKPFSPRSNRQEFCDRCGERNEAKGNRERQARFRKKLSKSLGVTV